MLDKLKSTDFSKLCARQFMLRASSEQTLELELIEVTEHRSSHEVEENAGGRRAFSLIFRGPLAPIMQQRIYELAHPELGKLELFLVPIGRDAEGLKYEAVFA